MATAVCIRANCGCVKAGSSSCSGEAGAARHRGSAAGVEQRWS